MPFPLQGDYIWLDPETSGEFDVAVGALVKSISGGNIHVVDDDKKVMTILQGSAPFPCFSPISCFLWLSYFCRTYSLASIITRYLGSTTLNCIISEARYIQCVTVFVASDDNEHVTSQMQKNEATIIRLAFRHYESSR